MLKASGVACVCLLTLLGSGRADADIYSFTEADGTINLSNVPADSRYSLFLKTADSTARKRQGSSPGKIDAKRFDAFIEKAAAAHQVDAALLHAVISAESSYRPDAVSPKGAIGLMQIMPETARRYGVTNPRDPLQNILGGAQYLRDLIAMFNNDIKLALAAYNAGENAVIRHGNRIPPYRETLQYVPKVLKLYDKFRTSKQPGSA